MDEPIRNDSLKSSDRLKQEVCKEHTVIVKRMNALSIQEWIVIPQR